MIHGVARYNGAMRMSFWQFLGLVAILAAVYVVYHFWWADQSQSTWIGKLQHRAIDSKDEAGPDEAKDYGQPDSWGR